MTGWRRMSQQRRQRGKCRRKTKRIFFPGSQRKVVFQDGENNSQLCQTPQMSKQRRTEQIPLGLETWRFLVTSGRLTSEIKVKAKCRDSFSQLKKTQQYF
jgi:hypothetical protein